MRGQMVPFFIGFTVAVLISLYAPLTQAGWNPARDLGPRIVAAIAGWGRYVHKYTRWRLKSWLTSYSLLQDCNSRTAWWLLGIHCRPDDWSAVGRHVARSYVWDATSYAAKRQGRVEFRCTGKDGVAAGSIFSSDCLCLILSTVLVICQSVLQCTAAASGFKIISKVSLRVHIDYTHHMPTSQHHNPHGDASALLPRKT